MVKVVVTGVGIVIPGAVGVKDAWRNICSGRSGINIIPSKYCDIDKLETKIAGVVGQDITGRLAAKDIRRTSRFTQLGLIAAEEALKDAKWFPETEEERCYTGVVVGSGIGGLEEIEANTLALYNEGARRVHPMFLPSCLINLVAGNISIKFGLKGPNMSTVSACASSAHAIIDGVQSIQLGETKVMVVGGAEASVANIGIAGFNALNALSTGFNDSPQQASRPWDERRDGFVMGEGAGILVLEEYEHAKKRGAEIYCEVGGYGRSGDAYHLTAPSSEGAEHAMLLALKRAGISNIDYINAHATSTQLGDKKELESIRRVLGEDVGKVKITSTKSMTGHLLGAAGAVEAILSILSLKHSIIPGTINLDDLPQEFEEFNIVANASQEVKVSSVLSNSFGFGGSNASLTFLKL